MKKAQDPQNKANIYNKYPFPFALLRSLLVPSYFFLLTTNADALPGQSAQRVVSWINAHPTLRPSIGDGLTVSKSSTPAQRFNFTASALPPGRLIAPRDRSTISSERLTLYDRINGVTFDRLQESLRTIYGPDIYQDYSQARLVYSYPTPRTLDRGRRFNLPLLSAQEGKLFLGKHYAYWLEITNTETGKAFNGQLTVFLKQDLDKLQTELSAR
ncbi:hypothetical protein [Lyngbya aestuarii]|uniref:hypothetical protein n=1 Tax=Lyngbya aestuarii TaxID=118322 RepID=UPI00403D8D11